MAREARARVADGSYGAVHTVHGSYLQDWLLDPDATNWRVDAVRGGPSRAFADIGSHWVDLAEWITGDRIVELVATTSINVADRPAGERETFSVEPLAFDAGRAPATTEDTACVLFRTSGGATGTLTVSQVAAGRKNRLWIEVDAQRNSVTFDQEDAEHLRIGDDAGAQTLARDPNQLSASARPYAVLPAGHPQGFRDCFDTFVRDVYRSIDDGGPVDGLPTFADGLRSAQVVEAVLASTRAHSWIEV
jgi:predicted dehydrogenase